jgi:hypothetical protein
MVQVPSIRIYRVDERQDQESGHLVFLQLFEAVDLQSTAAYNDRSRVLPDRVNHKQGAPPED